MLRKQTGFSLLELLLSIAIISLIILMATRYFGTVKTNQQVTSAVSMVEGVRAGVTAASAAGVGYTSTSTSPYALCSTSKVPKSMCTSTCTSSACNLVSPWESTTSAASNVAPSSGTSTTFDITIAGIPDSASCLNLCNTYANETTPATTCTTACSSPSSLKLTFS